MTCGFLINATGILQKICGLVRSPVSYAFLTAGAFAVDFACNHDPGVLLISPTARTKKTLEGGGVDCLVVPPPDFGVRFHLR